MRKKVSFLISVWMLSMTMGVHAEEFSGGADWKVTFDGKQMESNFKSEEINDVIQQLQPGDTAKFYMSLKNNNKETTSWYMANDVLQSLEDSQTLAEGGAYAYVLTYVKPDGSSNQLYNSKAIGGEVVNEAGKGLHQATHALKDFFFLDELEPNAQGTVLLSVTLEGETQGNQYQDTLAKLQMNFAVEPVNASGKTTTVLHKLVKTGDKTSVFVFSVAALIAGSICGGIAISKKRRQEVEK